MTFKRRISVVRRGTTIKGPLRIRTICLISKDETRFTNTQKGRPQSARRLLREINKGIANLMIRYTVLWFTPWNCNSRVYYENLAYYLSEKEISALLACDLLVPIVHGTTNYAKTLENEISPLIQ